MKKGLLIGLILLSALFAKSQAPLVITLNGSLNGDTTLIPNFWQKVRLVQNNGSGSSVGDSVLKNTDSIAAHNIRIGANTVNIQKNVDSIAAHNIRIGAVTVSNALKVNISDTSAMLQKYKDSLYNHNTRIGSNTTNIATNTADILLKAPLASPALTGTPTAPTAAAGTNTTQIATTAFVNTTAPKYIDVIADWGQSNAQGNSGVTTGTPTNSDTTLLIQYDSIRIKALNDPVGNATSTSAWPMFGLTYNKITGRRLCVVACAWPGSSMQTAANTSGQGTWDSTGAANFYDSAIARIARAVTALTAMGYTPLVRGVTWVQGEQDAVALNGSTVTSNGYVLALQRMIRRLRTVYPQVPFYISMVGTRTSTTDINSDSIRQAQSIVINRDTLTYNAFSGAAFFPTVPGYMADAVHYSSAGYNEMGRALAEAIASGKKDGFDAFKYYSGDKYTKTYLGYSNLGIGTVRPYAPLVIQTLPGATTDTVAAILRAASDKIVIATNSGVGNVISGYSASSTSTDRLLVRGVVSGGTIGAPTIAADGRQALIVAGSAYDGAAVQTPAQIQFTLNGTQTSGSMPMDLVFLTGTSTATERLRITSAGQMRLTNPTASGSGSGGFYTASGALPTGADSRLGGLSFAADNSTGFNIGAGIRGYSSQAWTLASAQGAYLSFYTTPTGSATQAEVWRMAQSGSLSNTAGTGTAYIHLKAGTTAAGTAGIKETSGPLMTSPEIGATEFLTDKKYFTITTGTARKEYTFNDAALTSGTTPVATTNGRLTDGLILTGSTYTPTLTNTTNVTSSTPVICHYTRIGNQVTVTGSAGVVTTLAVATVLSISLPVASNFAATTDAAGVGQASSAIATNAFVQGNTTSDLAELTFTGLSVGGSGTIYFTFTYTIIP